MRNDLKNQILVLKQKAKAESAFFFFGQGKADSTLCVGMLY